MLLLDLKCPSSSKPYNYLLNAPILLENILTAIAKSITPKNLRTASNPPGPNMRSIKLSDFNTMYTITRFTKMPPKI